MKVYLDASVLVPLFAIDHFAERAEALVAGSPDWIPVVSDFGAAEFGAAVSRRVRTKDLTLLEAEAAFASFDQWVARGTERVTTDSSDIAAAEAFVRRPDLNLRAPDAINIAIALRLGIDLATFDDGMAKAARRLGLRIKVVRG